MLRTALVVAFALVPGLALAQGSQGSRRARPAPTEQPVEQPATLGYLFGLTPQLPIGYDTGGYNDKHPELLPSQQGGGQQTGGPARNLIPGDRLHIVPQ